MASRQKPVRPDTPAVTRGDDVMRGFVLKRQDARPVPAQIAEHIERQVRDGSLRAGTRLPSTPELAAQAGVAPVTMQHSLATLVRSGLLERAPRRGTFVSSAVQAHNLALVFGDGLLVTDSPFYRLLYSALRRNAHESGFSITAHHISQENAHKEISRLESAITAGQVDAILPVGPGELFMRWLEKVVSVPWFSSSLWTDESEGTRLGLAYLLGLGFRRITVVSRFDVTHPPTGVWRQSLDDEMSGIQTACREASVDPDSIKVLHWGMHTRDGYEGARKLLASRKSRPAALFINHDVVTKGALVGLAEMGIRFPQDMALLTHANRGDDFPSLCPLTRVEYDVEALARGLFQQLVAYRGRSRVGMVSPKPIQVALLIPGASCGEKSAKG
jgi:DNA-binding LacI/PurR family transcriptional regulator